MAKYRFDRPWAAESQNVKAFTAEEWGTGIPFKSLTESKVVNGVLQDVTKRFLDLEAVEDRQYRFDFVVDDDLSWQNFVAGNVGDAKSILIRNGKWVTDTAVVAPKNVHYIQLEAAAIVNLNGGITMSLESSARISGGYIQGIINIVNAKCENVNFSSDSITLENTFVSNSFIYSARGGINGGTFNNCSISIATAENTKIVDCRMGRVSTLNDCVVVRTLLGRNVKLSGCTIEGCDYTVDTYTENLVRGTTFRACNLDVRAPNAVLNGKLFSNSADGTNCVFESCTLFFLMPNGNCVKGIARDCAFKPSVTGKQSVALTIEGNSSMQVGFGFNEAQFESKMRDVNEYGIMRTDNPFFRQGDTPRPWDLDSSNVIYPGALNVIRGNTPLTTFSDNSSYMVRYFFRNMPGSGVSAGSIIGASTTLQFVVPVSAPRNSIYYPEFSVVL